jgi:RNA polymerase sigma-70 factor (ECF subfamily)
VNPRLSNVEFHADELVVIRCQLGERDAFEALIERWHQPLWRYLRGLADSTEAADDLAQETWLRVLRGFNGLRDAARLRPWLFGIARRVAMDRLRQRYRRPTDAEAILEDIAAPEVDADLESDLAAMEAGMALLPPRERETLALFYMRGFTIDEMAQLLAVPAGTVKSRLYRARELMRRELNIKGVSR